MSFKINTNFYILVLLLLLISNNGFSTGYNFLDNNAESLVELNLVVEDTIQELSNSSEPIRTTRTYRVRPGDTKFSLARKFDVSIKALETENPNIVKMLMTGDIITVSNSKDPETMYIVAKGDTKFSLAKNNGITIRELEAQNPNIKKMLVTGQTIHIHKSNDNRATSSVSISDEKVPTKAKVASTPKPREKEKDINRPSEDNLDDSEYRLYTVEKTESLYSLSQKAEMKPSQFLLLNPHLTNRIQIGTEVKMPKYSVVFKSESEALNETETKPVNTEMAEAEKAETNTNEIKTSETKNVESPLPEKGILEPNPETKTAEAKPEPKTVEANPVIKTADAKPEAKTIETKSETKTPETKPVIKTAEVKTASTDNRDYGKYKDLSKSIANRNDISIAYVGPQQLKSLTADLQNEEVSSTENPEVLKYLNFYKGAQMAIDSIKRLGINSNFTISAISEKIDTTQEYSAILMPFQKRLSKNLTLGIKDNKIPIITTLLVDNPAGYNVINATPNKTVNKIALIDYAKRDKSNVIIVNDPNHESDLEFVQSQLNSTKVVTTRIDGQFDKDLLLSSLLKRRKNIVIIDSNDSNVFLGTTNLLLTKLNDYDIQLAVMDSQLIPDESIVSTKRYKILKMVYPSHVPAEATEDDAKFVNKYKTKYGQSPTMDSFYGFDIVYDLILRLSQQENLNDTFKNSITKQLNLKFQYEPKPGGGFENKGAYLFQYDPVKGIKEVE